MDCAQTVTPTHTHVDASAAYDSLANGPAAEKARIEGQKTSDEYANLMSSKKTPDTPAATGQDLTHYHSFFYHLLSWENPRVTTISFASIVTFIFFTRYVPILKYLFKALYVVLGITAAAEVAGKLISDRGLASRMRPRKYYTIPRQALEASVDDMEQLVNFFVIEFQRIIFAENVYATIGAFFTTFVSYFAVKLMPKWGLALLATTLIYTLPLIYINNREVIDTQLNNASNLVYEQTQQVRTIAAEQTSRATELAKSTASDYTARAQELMGAAKNRAAEADAPNPANLNPAKHEPEREIKKEDIQNAANDFANKASATASNVADQASATASNVADQTSATASNAANQASATASNAYNQASNTTANAYNQASNTTANAYNQASNTAANAANQASATASNLADQASSTAQVAADKTSNTAQVAADKTSNSAQLAADKTSSAADQASSTAQSSADTSSSRPTYNSTNTAESQITELTATSVPNTEPSFAAHSEPILRDEIVYHENSAAEDTRQAEGSLI